jgi:hypothetical protein
MTALMEEWPSISVELHPAEKIKTRKAKAEAKIDVIPNRAIRPVRACPELAEGNLLLPSSIKAAASGERNQD